MKEFIKKYWKLVFFATQSILFLYNNNWGMLYLHYLIKPLTISLVCTFTLAFILDKLLKNELRVLYIMEVILIFFYSYGFYQKFGVSGGFVFFQATSNILVRLSYIALFFAFIYLAYIPKFNLKSFTQIITNLFMSIFFMNIFLLAYGGFQYVLPRLKNPEQHVTFYENKSQEKPDIYVLVLDGHGRNDILKDIYGYDDSNFINELKSRGFYVQDNAITNYTQTYLSIVSLLKMDYLQSDTERVKEDSSDRITLVSDLAKNPLITTLENNGYDMVVYTTGWTGAEALKRLIGSQKIKGELSEFEFGILNNSILPLFLGNKMMYKIHAQRITHIFNDLPRIASDPKPTFTYAHILAPHPPFVFDENGKFRYDDRTFTFLDSEIKEYYLNGKDQYKNNYVAQLKYTDKTMLETIDKIMKNSKTPPIILVTSDHGPGLEYTYDNTTDKGIKERFSVFRAVYLPNKDYDDFSKINSHVNVFRIILNKYFQANLQYIQDTTLFNSTWMSPYKFIDVTSRYFK